MTQYDKDHIIFMNISAKVSDSFSLFSVFTTVWARVYISRRLLLVTK